MNLNNDMFTLMIALCSLVFLPNYWFNCISYCYSLIVKDFSKYFIFFTPVFSPTLVLDYLLIQWLLLNTSTTLCTL